MTRIPKLVAYLAHPVGAGMSPSDRERRQDNIANALGWLEWLVATTQWAVCVPWLPYVQRLDEDVYRDRGIADDLACLERCDLVVLTGGRVSVGMAAERAHAIEARIPIVDLTSFGFYPPTADDLHSAAAASMRARNAYRGKPRRVWLPPLDSDALEELKGNRAALRAYASGLSIGPWVDTLSAVIDAAEVAPA